jgi:outer membrane protein
MLSRLRSSGVFYSTASLAIGYFFLGAFFIILNPTQSVRAQNHSRAGIGLLDAVTITLERQPVIHLEQQNVEISRGILQQESGAFDTTLGASLSGKRQDIPLSVLQGRFAGTSHQLTDTRAAQLGLSKEFRTGVIVAPSVQVIRTDTSTVAADPQNAGTVNFLISVPLLKGLGVKATGANEMAAERDLQASTLTFRHVVSQNVLNTVSSYWSYLAAARIFDRRIESESRAEQAYSDTRKLVEGEERAAADLELVSANLAARTAARIEAEQTLFRAKHALGLAMGLSFEDIESLSSPLDEFPTVSTRSLSKIAARPKDLIEQSLLRRADYLAFKESQESLKILLEQAKNNLLPQFDLQIGVGYSGLDEGHDVSNFHSALRENIPGYSASASLTSKWPIQNNTARGLLLQSTAAYRKATIATDDLARNISSKVSQDISDLKNSALELIKYQEAVGYYQKAVENERQKFFLGMSTLSDLLTTEDSLINATIGKIAAEFAHARALVQLRFETGTLLADREDRISVGIEELTTVPSVEESTGN